VSRRWRIRHKLTLGLALVVGIIALLLGGTLKGLFSYRQTMKTIDSKLAELTAARKLETAVHEVATTVDGQATGVHNAQDLEKRIQTAQLALADYRQRLCDTLLHRRDLDKGYEEQPLVVRLQDHLNKLAELAKAKETLPPVFLPGNSGNDLSAGESRLTAQVKTLRETVTTLQWVIDTDLRRRIGLAKEDYRTSMMIVGLTSVLGLSFLVGLSWMAHRWIVDPIRELHQQVGRLAQGDFESRIEVKSSDEMRDLAHAFNEMTERLHAIYADLAKQVNERSRQLERSERLAGVGFLAAGVAHEINNPLASIAFCGEAL
jgi:HAMP domain-containing protein